VDVYFSPLGGDVREATEGFHMQSRITKAGLAIPTPPLIPPKGEKYFHYSIILIVFYKILISLRSIKEDKKTRI